MAEKKFNSFEELYETMFRGNEIEFKYNQKRYGLFPLFSETEQKVIGTTFGESYSDDEIISLTKEDLYNIKIDDALFGDIVPDLEILWRTL